MGLVKERSEYSGGQTGKHELLKHLAEELVEDEGNSETILDRFKGNTYELPESLEEKADKSSRQNQPRKTLKGGRRGGRTSTRSSKNLSRRWRPSAGASALVTCRSTALDRGTSTTPSAKLPSRC